MNLVPTVCIRIERASWPRSGRRFQEIIHHCKWCHPRQQPFAFRLLHLCESVISPLGFNRFDACVSEILVLGFGRFRARHAVVLLGCEDLDLNMSFSASLAVPIGVPGLMAVATGETEFLRGGS